MLDLNAQGSQLADLPEGHMEVLVDQPRQPSCGVAVVAHPQPLLGGSAEHKVPQVLARGLVEAGWTVLRPNFRGVGRSSGQHDSGLGEADDLLALACWLQRQKSAPRLALVGFSFGAFVQARVSRALVDSGQPAWRTALIGLPFGEARGGRRYDTPDGIGAALVVHGERDERVPLSAVFEWARPQAQPVTVVPGVDHFFTGKLHVLRSLIVSYLLCEQPD
jgi:uncharacterized protein